MKHLKLIINNENKKRDLFFNKKELQLILNLYAKMVSGGEWKDYGLTITKQNVSFNVYYKASEFPIYIITKTILKYISYVIQCYSYTIVNLLISEITKRCLND